MSWQPTSYAAAASRRQLILDCLAATPGAPMGEIVAYLSARGDTGSAANTVRTMADWRELRFEGTARSRRYFALVATTRSAKKCIAMREASLAAANAAKRREPESTTGSVHKPGRHPIKNQGGQGACRARVHINCGGIHA